MLEVSIRNIFNIGFFSRPFSLIKGSHVYQILEFFSRPTNILILLNTSLHICLFFLSTFPGPKFIEDPTFNIFAKVSLTYVYSGLLSAYLIINI